MASRFEESTVSWLLTDAMVGKSIYTKNALLLFANAVVPVGVSAGPQDCEIFFIVII